MSHTIFIVIHAGSGALALLAGCVAIARGALFATYFWSLVAMELFVVLAIAAQWTALDSPTRALFAALTALGLVMVSRADRARRMRPSAGAVPSRSYVGHVGFTLVALFAAFVAILVLDQGVPVWVVAGAGVLSSVVGHITVRAVRRRLAGPRPAAAPAPRLVRGHR